MEPAVNNVYLSHRYYYTVHCLNTLSQALIMLKHRTSIPMAISILYPLTTCMTFVLVLQSIYCERFTSVDELAKWSDLTRRFTQDLNRLIKLEEGRLTRLERIRESLLPLPAAATTSELCPDEDPKAKGSSSTQREFMTNPVNAFVILNRLNRAIKDVNILLGDDAEEHHHQQQEETTTHMRAMKDIFDGHRDKMPVEEDLKGSGGALLRLQSFYGLKTSDLVNGIVAKDQSSYPSYRMDARDCFELARVVYENNQFAPAIIWFYAALEEAVKEKASTSQQQNHEHNRLINDILDHMAYSAYSLDLLEYAAKLTEVWLERDPHNERARENLEYYRDELAAKNEEGSTPYTTASEDEYSKQEQQDPIEQANQATSRGLLPKGTSMNHPESVTKISDYKNLNLDEYLVEDDEIVRQLCCQSGLVVNSTNKCEQTTSITRDNYFTPGLKIETLSRDPKIIRIYDIISKKEARHLRRVALPKLERSTVVSSGGYRTSDFRIAKTAWLKGDADDVVQRIERRLASVLDIGMENSEYLQVVNYGLGGFYGPHLDSSRASNLKGNDSALIYQLQRSDRLATVLIYLNQVEAGGSTVFPRLNLTVTPIERSAVVWFNIQDNGYSDERTLHTGCPVLLGSKWIATKWPHEEANSFRRPCKLQMIDKRET